MSPKTGCMICLLFIIANLFPLFNLVFKIPCFQITYCSSLMHVYNKISKNQNKIVEICLIKERESMNCAHYLNELSTLLVVYVFIGFTP